MTKAQIEAIINSLNADGEKCGYVLYLNDGRNVISTHDYIISFETFAGTDILVGLDKAGNGESVYVDPSAVTSIRQKKAPKRFSSSDTSPVYGG